MDTDKPTQLASFSSYSDCSPDRIITVGSATRAGSMQTLKMDVSRVLNGSLGSWGGGSVSRWASRVIVDTVSEPVL